MDGVKNEDNYNNSKLSTNIQNDDIKPNVILQHGLDLDIRPNIKFNEEIE